MSNYTDNKLAESNPNTAWMQVIELVPKGAKIFDVGCSGGTLGEELIRRKNCIVDGIEPDILDAGTAGKKLRHVEAIIAEDDRLYDFFPEKYDAILFIDVIEHLVNPSEVLERVKKMLKPGGEIIFSIPNMAHASVRFSLLRGNFDYTQSGLLDQTHLHFYTEEQIQRVFSSAGYRVSEINCSSLTYPKHLSDTLLGEIGLVANKNFYEILKETNGYIYQYIGKAIVSKDRTTPAKAPKINLHEKDFEIMNDGIAKLKKYISDLEKLKIKLEEQIKLKEQHINNIENILQQKDMEMDEFNSRLTVKLSQKIKILKKNLRSNRTK